MAERSNYIEGRLVGKTIKSAAISGLGVYLDFTDGSRLEYAVSDDGYSTYGLFDVHKSPSKPSLP